MTNCCVKSPGRGTMSGILLISSQRFAREIRSIPKSKKVSEPLDFVTWRILPGAQGTHFRWSLKRARSSEIRRRRRLPGETTDGDGSRRFDSLKTAKRWNVKGSGLCTVGH